MTTIEAILFENALLAAEVADLKAKLTVAPEATATAAKGRKGRKAPKAPEVRFVTTRNLVAFGEAIAADFETDGSEEPWTLEALLDSLREYGAIGDQFAGGIAYYPDTVGVVGMPEGWGFGPKALHYLASGQWPS